MSQTETRMTNWQLTMSTRRRSPPRRCVEAMTLALSWSLMSGVDLRLLVLVFDFMPHCTGHCGIASSNSSCNPEAANFPSLQSSVEMLRAGARHGKVPPPGISPGLLASCSKSIERALSWTWRRLSGHDAKGPEMHFEDRLNSNDAILNQNYLALWVYQV